MKKAALLGLCLLPCIYSSASYFEENPNPGASEHETLQRLIQDADPNDPKYGLTIFEKHMNIITPEDMQALIAKYPDFKTTKQSNNCLIKFIQRRSPNITLFSYLLKMADQPAPPEVRYTFIKAVIQETRYSGSLSDEEKGFIRQYKKALKKFYNQDEEQRKSNTDLDRNERLEKEQQEAEQKERNRLEQQEAEQKERNRLERQEAEQKERDRLERQEEQQKERDRLERQEEQQSLKEQLRLHHGSIKDYLSAQNLIIAALLALVGRYAHKHWYQTERKNTS